MLTIVTNRIKFFIYYTQSTLNKNLIGIHQSCDINIYKNLMWI